MYSYRPLHMAEQKQDDQLEHTYSSYVRIRDVALKTSQRRWTIGRSGERGSGISLLAARHDDDNSYRIQIILNRCIWLTEKTLTDAITLGKSEAGSNENEEVFHIFLTFRTRTSASDLAFCVFWVRGGVLNLTPLCKGKSVYSEPRLQGVLIYYQKKNPLTIL